MATVRLAIVDEIASGLARSTGLRVHRNLDYAIEDRNLPAISVTSGNDQPADSAAPLGVLDQEVQVDINIIVARSANPEATVDPHEAAIHSWLYSITELAGQPVLVDRISGAWDFDLGDCGARRLSYRFGYRTSANNLEN